jgi:hypothetical protein
MSDTKKPCPVLDTVLTITDLITDTCASCPNRSPSPAVRELVEAAKRMDWMQVVLNGEAPCFHIGDDGRFCGRAKRWIGHEKGVKCGHAFVAFAEAIAAVEQEVKP